MLSKHNESESQLKLKNKRLTLSIAMYTFNGADYLPEQLDSITKQIRLPDELIVCDDDSTDMTLQILNNFRKNASFQVKIYYNIERLGPTKNFEKAIILCTGDIIVLSDQDDVWLSHKIEKLEHIFKSNPDIGYIFSNAILFDENISPFNYTLWDSIPFTINQREKFKKGYQVEILLKRNVVTGATMTFRKELKELILPIPIQWMHDEWIALLASAVGARGIFIEEPLIKYRQHIQQAIGGKRMNLVEQIIKAYNIKELYYKNMPDRYKYALDRLALSNKLTKHNKMLFLAKIKHFQTRQSLHNQPRWRRFNRIMFKEIMSGQYDKYSNGWKNIMKDLFFTIIFFVFTR